LYQFALSPIDEVQQAVQQASLTGHRNAIILAPRTADGQRMSQYFQHAWEASDGNVLQHIRSRSGMFLPVISCNKPGFYSGSIRAIRARFWQKHCYRADICQFKTKLAERNDLSVPVMTLNYVEGLAKSNLYQFALSPIDEVQQAVQQASLTGHRNAIILA
jgi:outer membrane PBP1 activator LpoA protein